MTDPIKTSDRTRDEPYPHEQDYLGKVVRIEVPLRSVISLRRVADELRGLAAKLDFMSHERTERPGEVLLGARMAVRGCNQKMKAIRGPGRPKKHQTLDQKKPIVVQRKSRKADATHKM
jgi:hypothetical protein